MYEIIAILFSLYLAFPDYVFLNRGNHEDHVICCQPPPPHGRRRCLAKRASRLSGRALASDSFRWLGLTDLLVTKLVGSSRQRLPVNIALGRYIRRQ